LNIIKSAEFITSYVRYGEPFPDGLPEIAVVGRSNVGKSSFINMLCGVRQLARVSNTPGRTRLINLFRINGDEFYIVDLPGYGFQAGAKSDTKDWAAMIEGYLCGSPELKQVILLADIRHAPTEQDITMQKYLYFNKIPYTVIATKSDKLSKMRIASQLRELDNAFGVGIDNIIPVSNETGYNKDKVTEAIFSRIRG
jgi:GTP-binding protein